MYIWDCETTPYRPALSPLPSFAVRRQAAKREAGAENGWTKRPALWLRAIKDKTEMAKIRALGGNEEDLPKVGSVAFEI